LNNAAVCQPIRAFRKFQQDDFLGHYNYT